ncbi:carboxypeptidase-like regulatory domain-containing protein [uncultured Tenacibaculum sp.]|uniref:TonB-dependent receptor n=1 Tax=uncultured Tenacibaculum sp. TaxID=174713 RepID=UPI00262483F8|nr:carboxypeptidase-like regulatory domain-containing protein [uncultured Tenacibaculum sp.]
MKKLICFVLLSLSLSVFAQNKTTRLRHLKDVLIELSDLYSVKFSFSDEIVNNQKIPFKSEKDKDISSIIKDLEKYSKLNFKKISKNRYAISRLKNRINICGNLFSKHNKEPLIGATITLKNKNIGTQTDIDGYFELRNLHITDTVNVSYVGFKSKKRAASSFSTTGCSSLFLEEENAVLNEIVITNYLTNGLSKTIDGALVFKPKNQDIIPGLTEPDVFYTVQQLPGIVNVDETATGMHIRGGTPDQNLILFNQIKLFTASHFFGAISALNPETIDKVEVYRGTSKAKYGNHIGGVINVETGNNIPSKIKGSVGMNFTHADANVSLPISPKLSISVSGRRSITDVLNTPTYRQLSQKAFQHTIISKDERLVQEIDAKVNTDFFFQDFNTKLIYKPTNDDKISFSQISIKNSLDHSFFSPDFNDKRSDDLLIKNDGYNIEWDKQWNSKINSKTTISYSDYSLKYRNNKQKDNTLYAFTSKDNHVKNLDINTSLDYKINTSSKFSLGYQYAYNDVHFLLGKKNDLIFVEKYSNQSDINQSHSFFTEYLYNKNKNIIVSLGARANHFSLLNKTTFEPRAYTQIQVLPKFWLNSSFEIKQQNISRIVEFYTTDFGLENQLWALSNQKDIPLLESQQITIGALFNKNNWLIDIDVYKRNIKGITSLTSGFDSFTRDILTGESKTLGLDFLIKKNWKNYNTWLSYHTGKTTFLINDFNENKEFTGNFDVTHSFYFANNFKYKEYNFSLGYTYRIGIPFTSNNGLANNYFIERNGINDSRLPNYSRLDFSAGYDFHMNKKKTIKGRFNISLLNILNRKNILKRTYDVVQENKSGFGEGKLIEQDTESLGFTPNVSFRLSF